MVTGVMAKTATPGEKSTAPVKKTGAGKTTRSVKAPKTPIKKTRGRLAVAGKGPVTTLKKGKTPVKPVTKKVPKASGKKTATIARYRCKLCGYVYSPLRGEPHNNIPAGTGFDDLPEDYVCPICGYEGKGRIGKWGFEEWHATRYICSVCGYVYDEKRGEPHRGIKAGTKFEDLPDDYICPVCALDPKIRVQFGKVFKQGFEALNIS
ncbi:MAG: rubredoxin [Methanoregula sp.]|jgi:rubredoxin|nr:rubredoxin [Methanoregula sp.]